MTLKKPITSSTRSAATILLALVWRQNLFTQNIAAEGRWENDGL
jgi:hypothetical protein